MSTLPAVSMQDLELEHAELLPSRETLCSWHSHGGSVNNSFNSIGNVNQSQGFGLVQTQIGIGGGNSAGLIAL
jgi:hypothetical protein